ncbi:hypothetical protein CONCODRAFT_72311 [Conidiobolus coronatus NRRL 28638]|uniref:Uncharacterized protein n=1 Tax=Conidiobolus coronatus (strain ATCC 28846 / CBS 209.66 / NRRL 28638) TaxID=796925 RepID=A0A137P0G0_CONC2|nr:hypothetical protein CONCODRAFT_72311 [Conidiobolus coronatus NRRL 28638]|eukprot:KXN68349.1 hypothetical protein CONCODRAFT_72311 [Conidiobolus coronatus NRRL 28638]
MDKLIEFSEGSLSDLKENYEGLCLITNVYIELIPLTSYYSAKLAPTYLGLKHCLTMLSEIENWDYNELRFIDLVLNIGYQIHEETPHSTLDHQTKKRDLNILSHHIAHLVVFIRDFKHLYWDLRLKLINNNHSQLTLEFPTWIKDIIGYALENTYPQLNGNEAQDQQQSTLHLRIKKLASIVLLPPPTLNPQLYIILLQILWIVKLQSSSANFIEEICNWNIIKQICKLLDGTPTEYQVVKDGNYDDGKLIELYDTVHWANLLTGWILSNGDTLRPSLISSLELIGDVGDSGWELLLALWSKIYSKLPVNYQIQIFLEVIKLIPNYWQINSNLTRLQLLILEFSKYFNNEQKLIIGQRLTKYINIVLTKQSQEALMIISQFPLANLSLEKMGVGIELICDILNWIFTNIKLFLQTQQHFNLLSKVLINLNCIKIEDEDNNNEISNLLRKFDKPILDYILMFAPDVKYMMFGDGQILIQGVNYFHSIKNLSDSKSIDLLSNVSQWLDFEPDLLNEFIFLKLTLKLLTKASSNATYKSQSLFYSKKIIESYLLTDDWASQLYVLYNIYSTGIVGFKSIMLQLIPSNFKLNLVNFLKSVAKPDESIIEELREFEYPKDKENASNSNCSNWFKLNPIVNYPELIKTQEFSSENLNEYLVNTYKLEKLLDYLNISSEEGDNYREKMKLPFKRLKTKLN